MSLDALLAVDALACVASDLMAGTESVTYRPKGKSTADRVVSANVDRGGVRPMLGATGVAAPFFTIFVTKVDVPHPAQGDQFFFAGDASPHAFARIVKEDSAGYLLEIR